MSLYFLNISFIFWSLPEQGNVRFGRSYYTPLYRVSLLASYERLHRTLLFPVSAFSFLSFQGIQGLRAADRRFLWDSIYNQTHIFSPSFVSNVQLSWIGRSIFLLLYLPSDTKPIRVDFNMLETILSHNSMSWRAGTVRVNKATLFIEYRHR